MLAPGKDDPIMKGEDFETERRQKWREFMEARSAEAWSLWHEQHESFPAETSPETGSVTVTPPNSSKGAAYWQRRALGLEQSLRKHEVRIEELRNLYHETLIQRKLSQDVAESLKGAKQSLLYWQSDKSNDLGRLPASTTIAISAEQLRALLPEVKTG